MKDLTAEEQEGLKEYIRRDLDSSCHDRRTPFLRRLPKRKTNAKGIDIVPRNKELTLEITSRCQLSCAWCSSSSSPDGKDRPTEDCINALKILYPQCNVVRISGGEPTLHPDLDVIIRLAKEMLYRVVLLTNGLYLPTRYLEKGYNDIDEFVVHLADKRSFYAAEEYLNYKKNVSLHIVAVKGNEASIRNAIGFAIASHIPLRVLALQKQGRGVNCEPSDLITWRGMSRCQANNKITVAMDGTTTTCSALKYRRKKCDLLK